MAERTLLTVGYDIPGFSDSYLPFNSDRSLLDADVVLFYPTLQGYSTSSYYMGKRRLSNDDSGQAVEHCRRWKQELTEVLKAGKTVIVFLAALEEVYVYLGQQNVSGTGRNQKVTLLVEPLTNYVAIPIDFGTIIPKGGTEIRTTTELKYLATYWSEFGDISPYRVYFKGPSGTPLLTAKSPDAVIGFLARIGKGTALLLPPVRYDEEEFTTTNKKGEECWTKGAIAFGNRLVNALMELDRALRADSEMTPAPEWVHEKKYTIPEEVLLEEQVEKVEQEIEKLRIERDNLQGRATEIGLLRDLLYEAGKPLERAIIRGLKAMGFTAVPFKEDGSEFDVVFSSSEGRFLGEAEGRNDKAIGIEKLDQLERNIREDFARQQGDTFAKGVLFGNAFRLRQLPSRPDFFTQKCYAAATRSKVALVRTPDLFAITRYLESKPDPKFAAACRVAILNAEGVVVAFPPLPAEDT